MQRSTTRSRKADVSLSNPAKSGVFFLTPLYIDFETRSPVDLRKEGLARYARHPLTEALCMAWAFGDNGIDILHSSEPVIGLDYVADGGIVVAHNAAFEIAVWNEIMVKRYGWPRLRIEQVRCTMAACYAQSLPGALENAAHALGLKITKDTEGRALMLRMCKPRADGTYYDTPEARARLGEYCKQDVAVEREIYKRVLPLPDREQKLWELDQVINLRGVPFDMDSLKAALTVADSEKERLNKDMATVTQGAVTACSALPALKEWAADYGVLPDSLAKAELNDMLEEEAIPEIVKVALRIRQAAGRFTSISKLNAIKRRQIDGRVPNTFQYHAATTGRWAGRGIQPHNFTRDLPEPEQVEDILRSLREGCVRWLDIAYGEPSIMISKCLRGFIHAAPGKLLMGGDFANVEGRGIAWLAGEKWKLKAFEECDANPDLPDMYVRAYSKSFGVPVEKVTKEQRQIGKVQELAFGYGGGAGAFHTMGKTFGVKVSDAKAEEFKDAWRAVHTMIRTYWYDLETAAKRAVEYPGEVFEAGHAGRAVKFRKRGSFLWCRLPSGRNLCYPYPTVEVGGRFGQPSLTYKGVPDTMVWSAYIAQKERGEANTTYVVDDPSNSREWCRIATYGGKLAENITQAICRDLLAEAIVRVEAAGFPVVLHVHDEVVCEGDFNDSDLFKFQELMTVVPDWAAGFPIAAGCWLSARYIKG